MKLNIKIKARINLINKNEEKDFCTTLECFVTKCKERPHSQMIRHGELHYKRVESKFLRLIFTLENK